MEGVDRSLSQSGTKPSEPEPIQQTADGTLVSVWNEEAAEEDLNAATVENDFDVTGELTCEYELVYPDGEIKEDEDGTLEETIEDRDSIPPSGEYLVEENTEEYDEIADFDVDDFSEDAGDDDEPPDQQDIYQRCQLIRRKRFYNDLYNAWEQKVRDEEKEEAIQILTACGFVERDPDEIAEGLDAALRLIPERFWQQDSKAKAISIDQLKLIVEQKKDAEEREQFQQLMEAADHEKVVHRRAAIATGLAGPSALLHNYLRMNLIKTNVPMHYFPSYLFRYTVMMSAAEKQGDDEEVVFEIQQSSWTEEDPSNPDL